MASGSVFGQLVVVAVLFIVYVSVVNSAPGHDGRKQRDIYDKPLRDLLLDFWDDAKVLQLELKNYYEEHKNDLDGVLDALIKARMEGVNATSMRNIFLAISDAAGKILIEEQRTKEATRRPLREQRRFAVKFANLTLDLLRVLEYRLYQDDRIKLQINREILETPDSFTPTIKNVKIVAESIAEMLEKSSKKR